MKTPTPGARFKRPARREIDIQRAILDYLKVRRIMAWPVNNGGHWNEKKQEFKFYGVRGVPDINGVLPGGRALFIEVKNERGRLRPEQEAFRDMARARGALWILARSVDEVIAALPPVGTMYVWCQSGEPCLMAAATEAYHTSGPEGGGSDG